MKDEIKDAVLKSLQLRSGMKGRDALLKDMIDDSITDVRNFLNYKEDEELPKFIAPAVKELTLIRFNRDGAEGIQSESQSSGGSTSYIDMLPDAVKRTIRRYRRLPR